MAAPPSKPGRGPVPVTVAVVAAAATLYGASCCLPATGIGSFDLAAINDGPLDHRPTIGWAHVAFGWLDMPRSLLGWWANFVLWAGMIAALRGRSGLAAALGALAAILGLSTFSSYKCDSRYIGFYLWTGSQVVFAVGASAVWVWYRPWRKSPNQALQIGPGHFPP